MNNSSKEMTKITEAENGRWPRQETLSLLEIRTRLNPMFKGFVSKKSPLWDEVSRLMAEEHGYQRSGKKCKEKLDNLYKYYKKTKGLNKGRKDGRNYRFFRQLETLYTENNTCESKLPDQNTPLQIRNVSGSEDSEEEEEYGTEWSLMVKEMIGTQVKRVMEMQESLLGKMLKTIESIEEKRAAREEAWRREEIARSQREEREWEREKLWIENRNAALSRALEKFSCECFSWKCGLEEEESLMSLEMEVCGRNIDEREVKWRCDDEFENLVDIRGWEQSELGFHFYHDEKDLFDV